MSVKHSLRQADGYGFRGRLEVGEGYALGTRPVHMLGGVMDSPKIPFRIFSRK